MVVQMANPEPRVESLGYSLSGWLENTRGPLITLESHRHPGGPFWPVPPRLLPGAN